MKISFPNPYGYKLPSKDRVASIQKDYKFSDDYASFLLSQNGFLVSSLEEDIRKNDYLSESEEDSEGKPGFRVLYGLNSNDKYYDLEDNLQSFIFKDYFFPIGSDYGGNDFVEILAGKFKGYIASLDHELYAAFDSLEEFIEEFKLENFDELPKGEKTDMLSSDNIGIAWIVAPSMQIFTENCIHCDSEFCGYVLDLISKES